ncbi:YqaA family protein [Shewanella sp. NIFS-20-20]|uniref:YqaA family protein n=1 Tax=Shewanella sp. NIFS-20-20 TaxID=2853806 RepID=UPI001C4593BF|nr:YqaA family protein [Shewanella sp. NIFS-20-20]MBV7316906.1 DedA family protein [Shewanella sp. NIFS-20-20]
MLDLGMMFAAAFLAATLLPGGSEVLLVALLTKEGSHAWALVVAASLGNTLGSMTSYLLGLYGRRAISPEQMATKGYRHGLNLIQKYGMWSLLLAWVPVVGDLLCVIAGWMKLPILPASLLIFIGKFIRYLLLMALTLQWL